MDLFHWELLFALAGWLRGLGGGMKLTGLSRTTRFLPAHFVRTHLRSAWFDDLGLGVLRNVLPALGLDGLLGNLDAGQNLRQALSGIELVKQGVADHDAMHAHGFQLLDLLERAHARLQDAQASALGHLLQQGQGLLPTGLPGLQVPAQHADDIRVGVQGPLEVGLAGHLHDHVQVLGPGKLLEGHKAVRFEQGGHEEDTVRSEDLALLDLVLLEDEVMAKQRHLHRGTDIRKVLVLSVEKEAVGGHGDDPGTILHQALGVSGRSVALPDLAAQRVATSRFGDDGNPGLAQFLLQRVMPLVGVLHCCRPFLLLDFDVQCFEYLDFFQHLKPPGPIGSRHLHA